MNSSAPRANFATWTTRPCVAAVVVLLLISEICVAQEDQQQKPIRIVLVGDSTMASYEKPPADRPDLTGWGQVLGEFFNDRVTIDNQARSGRSSKSFIDEGHWAKAIAKPTDYVFIQFGHNDASDDPKRRTDPDSDFQDLLRKYIAETQAIDARPVLITPVASRTYRNGKAYSNYRKYADAMIAVGAETGVPVLDLNTSSVAMVNEVGQANSAALFASKADRTHFSRKGAIAIAKLAARDLPTLVPDLKPWIVSGSETDFVVVGYLPDYRLPNWSKEIGPVTDLILFGADMPASGKFDSSRISKQFLSTATAIKKRKRCRVLFTVGGWGKSAGFAAMTADRQQLERFVNDVRDFCLANKLDGVDYDWEHPEGAAQLKAYADLIQLTSEQFKQHGLLVTVALAPWQDLGHKAWAAVDRIHLMSYDHEFPQATFEKSTADVETVIAAGCPPQKIVLGLPFYGRNKARAAKTFAELAASKQLVEGKDELGGFAFNSAKTIARKIDFAQEARLGGVMIWEIAQDSSDNKSLMRAISRELESGNSTKKQRSE